MAQLENNSNPVPQETMPESMAVDLSKTSHAKAMRIAFIPLALVATSLVTEGCATAPGTRPDSASIDESDPETSLLRQFGASEEGKQSDGSYIKVSTSKKKSSAFLLQVSN